MKVEPTYYGPVRITGGEFAGKAGFVDDYDEEDGVEVGIVYLEGQEPTVGHYDLVPVEHLEQPDSERERQPLEERLAFARGTQPPAKIRN